MFENSEGALQQVIQSKNSDLPGLRLNELLASNRTGILDDEGRSSDWVEIYNPGTGAIRLGRYYLTNDPKTLDKWAFPNNRIAAGGYLLVWMSGLDRTSLAPEALRASAATIPFETTLIETGAEWKYLSGASNAKTLARQKTPNGWNAVNFDDKGFAVGRAGFGYGDEDDATKLPHGTTVVLLRREFTLKDPLMSELLVLQVDYDDGFAAYLNGTRVAAANAPAGEPGFDSTASGSHEAGVAERFDLSAYAGLLRRGKNVLALAGFNTHRASSDMSLKTSLGILPAVCHANFRLNKNSGTLYLVAPDGNIADQINYRQEVTDQSLGRSASSRADWGYFLTPSPGSANLGPQQTKPVKSRISFDPEPGAIEQGDEVRINDKSSSTIDIRYTNDGSDPDASSLLYRAPIKLLETSLLRAAAFIGKERVSATVPATYLVGPRPALPILSVSMKPGDFLDVHLRSSASGRASERKAFFELFDPAGKRKLATGFGLRLHGGAGRRGGLETKKSYRAYFRQVYGEGRVDYPIIPEAKVEDFDKLVLRSNFNDGRSHGSYIRDQVIRDLHRDMGALSSSGSWYVLLVNSINHGVFNVVERMDEEFFISHLGPGQYDVMKTGDTVLNGTRQGWEELRSFISSTDFSNQANFEELSRRVDIGNFTSYVILNLWSLNLDWPHNNWYAARRVPDGKWIFLCWDAEWGLGGVPSYRSNLDPYAFIDSGGAYGHGLSRKLFFALLGNPGYSDYYQKEVRRYLSTALSPKNALRHIHRHRDAIAVDIENEFGARGSDKEQWHSQIVEIKKFIKTSGAYFQKYTDDYFSQKTSPINEDRVAFIEGESGRRHMAYRAADGQIHELSVSSDGSRAKDSTISMLAKAPLAAGHPSAYILGSGNRRVLYRGMSGHLHELSGVAVGADVASWRHTNLTEQLDIPVASCDPSVVVFDGVPHIVYVDRTARLREIWFDERWRQHPLLAAPRPAGDVVISRSTSSLHVTYRTMFGAACEQTHRLSGTEPHRRSWTPRLIHRLPAAGIPVGFNKDGKRRIIFRAAEKWPTREPFIFDWIERRQPNYQRYRGPRNTFVQARDNGERFRRLEPIGKSTHQIAGNPCVIHDVKLDRHHLAFREVNGHVREATLNDGSWLLTDPTALAGAPPAAGEPSGLVSALTGSRYYVYRGREGHLHELRFDDSWSHRDLSASVSKTSK